MNEPMMDSYRCLRAEHSSFVISRNICYKMLQNVINVTVGALFSASTIAVGQAQLGPAIRVNLAESAMAKPHRRGPVFLITRASQPGKFMSGPVAASPPLLSSQQRLVEKGRDRNLVVV